MPEDGNNHLKKKKKGIRQNFFYWKLLTKEQTSKEWMGCSLCLHIWLDVSLEGFLQSRTRLSPCMPGWNAVVSVMPGFVNHQVSYLPPTVVSSVASHLHLACINTEYRKREHFRPFVIIYPVHTPSPWVQVELIASNIRTQTHSYPCINHKVL